MTKNSHKQVVETARDAVRTFTNRPSEDTFDPVVDNCWTIDRRNMNHYAEIDLEEFAASIEDADGPWDLIPFEGTNGGVATELLFHRSPEEHVLWNSRSGEFLADLGYEEFETNNLGRLTDDNAQERYDEFRDAVEDVHDRYYLPLHVEEARGVAPSDRSVYEVFDDAAFLYSEGRLDLSEMYSPDLSPELYKELEAIRDRLHFMETDDVVAYACRQLIQEFQ